MYDTQAQLDALAKQEEEKRKATHNADVNAKIGIKNLQILAGEAAITSLNNSRKNIQTELDNWNQTWRSCRTKAIVQNVTVNNRFEGCCADELKKTFKPALMNADENQCNGHKLITELDSQIKTLQNSISNMKTQITQLKATLIC